ncbi:MAG: TonB-dependent receptor [Limisphaerales bacterium]
MTGPVRYASLPSPPTKRPALPRPGNATPPRIPRAFHSLLATTWQAIACVWLAFDATTSAQTVSGVPPHPPEAVLLSFRGTVEISRGPSDLWQTATTNNALNAGDALRTAEFSQATLLLRNRSVLQVSELTTFRIAPNRDSLLFQFFRGLLYFFHREGSAPFEVQGAGINAAVLGTDVAFRIDSDGASSVHLHDGKVRLRHNQGDIDLRGGESVRIGPNLGLADTRGFAPRDYSSIQWILRYPPVLIPEDLGWLEPPEPALAESLRLYRSGSVARAFAAYPAGRTPSSPEEALYLAALWLSIGGVPNARELLENIPAQGPHDRIAQAFRNVLDSVILGETPSQNPAIVHHDPAPSSPVNGAPSRDASQDDKAAAPSPFATELLAATYLLQAQARLPEALDHARIATEHAPRSGHAWARRAELAFALGRTREARSHLERALTLSPQLAEARTLHGFVDAADNRIAEAITSFNQAIDLDPTLADAWLGRGLCRIRKGRLDEGRTDLLIAAAREPQRSLLRSYLGKAFASDRPFHATSQPLLAHREFDLARQLDPADPTPYLYEALLDQKANAINGAVDALQESLLRNDERAVFRSRLGLDQDRAVRGANLAGVFGDAGLPDIALREATRAVNADYANASAHLFLANSYDLQRDSRRIHLRYETAWHSEYLLGNLLAPVGAGPLSQTVANQEYSRLFEQDRLGVANATLWTSNGDLSQHTAQFGLAGNLAYSLDAQYLSRTGQRPNDDSEQTALSATTKIQAGRADDFFLQVGFFQSDSGDTLPRYDPSDFIEGLRVSERHHPTAQIGWHHTWNPGIHTLALVSPWNLTLEYNNPAHSVPYTFRDSTGITTLNQGAVPLEAYRSDLTGASVELQQIWQASNHTLIAGARYQSGDFDTTARLATSDFSDAIPADSSADPRMERFSVYALDQWKIAENLLLTLGVTHDRLTQPVNFRTAPVFEGADHQDLTSPKLGLTFQPWRGGVLRSAWTRSLGGVSVDQSQRLEPVQIAGFTQAYRGLLPESLTGSVSGQRMETLGFAWDQTFRSRTWTTVSIEQVRSQADRTVGGYAFSPAGFEGATGFAEDLEFVERSISATVGQLIGRDVVASLRYRLADADLRQSPAVRYDNVTQGGHQNSTLGQLTGLLRYHHPSGFFASFDTVWTRQTNRDDIAELAGDNFWQLNLWLGWRFLLRRAELAVGLLNLTDTDYRLHPLNDPLETYRERTLAVSGRFAF